MGAFDKFPIPSPPKKQLTEKSEIMSQMIINKPSDLAKLLTVLKTGFDENQLANHQHDLKRFVVDHFFTFYEESGELAINNCLDMAEEYQLIRIETDADTGIKRYTQTPRLEVNLSNDWFCFHCDVMVAKYSIQFLKCDFCLRVFHRRCVYEFPENGGSYKCRFCKRVEEDTNRYINVFQSVKPKRINRVIVFLLDFVKKQMNNKVKSSYNQIDINFEENDYNFVFKKMSLSLIKEKAEREEYNTLMEWEDDLFVYIHNLNITQIDFEGTDKMQYYLDFRTYLLKELEELKICIDCYERVNDKTLHETNKEWLCLPCDPIHTPVFVKVKNNPYWPAKIIRTLDDNRKVEVYYFEAEKSKSKSKGRNSDIVKKGVVKVTDTKDIHDFEILTQIKDSQRLIKPLEVLIKYLESMPDNKRYIKAIEFIKNNSPLKPTTSRSLTTFQSNDASIEESIESAIKSNMKSRTPQKSRAKNKETPKMSLKPKSQHKSLKKRVESLQTSSSSTRSSSPVAIPVLTNMLINDSKTSVDSISDRVPNLNISEEPPALDLYKEDRSESPQNSTKRRSGRIAAQITPLKTEIKTEIDVKPSKGSKRKEQNKSTEEIEPMEVDGNDSQTTLTNETSLENIRIDSPDSNSVPQSSQSVRVIVVNNSEQNISFDEIQNKDNTQSLAPIDLSTSSHSKQKDLSSRLIDSNSPNVLSLDLRPGSQPAMIKSTSMTSVCDNNSSAVTSASMATSTSITTTSNSSGEKIVPLIVETPLLTTPSTSASALIQPSTSFATAFQVRNENLAPNVSYTPNKNNQFSAAEGQRLQLKIEKLMEIHGPTEELIVIDFDVKKLLKDLEATKLENKQLKNDMQDIKTKRWCVVCQRLAKHYCCVRFYCSQECQRIDWRNGHHSQCLDK